MKTNQLSHGTTAASAPAILKSTVFAERSSTPNVQAASFGRLLLERCNRVIARNSSPELVVQLEVRVDVVCPASHQPMVLWLIDELICNAVEHGFYNRRRGRLLVLVASHEPNGLEASVSDDGWGAGDSGIIDGNGFHLLRLMGDLRLGAACDPFTTKAAITVGIPKLGPGPLGTRNSPSQALGGRPQ